MTVSELIELLKTKQQDMVVVYRLHSEYCMIEELDLEELDLCEPRPDGWVACKRPDKPTQKYLKLC